MVISQAEKTKTKAKQRYLKVKKIRRKKRKASVAEALRKNNVKTRISGSEGTIIREQQREASDVVTSNLELSQGEDHVFSSLAASKVENDDGKRFRKKRKITLENNQPDFQPSASPISSSDHTSLVDVQKDNQPLPEAAGIPSDPSQSAPLTSFPTPSAPVPASKQTLALQGLDPGLVDAQIVDATHTIYLERSDGSTPQNTSVLGLSLKTLHRLKDLGIVELFAVQTALLPYLLPTDPSGRRLYMPYNPPRDVCVSAPTGSGKTLAYVLPILEILSARIVTRLRALVVLPTRDLVTQVRETFEAVCKGRGLKIGTATGQHSFAHEQAQLVERSSSVLQGGSSKVDILICTPGRLIDHLNGTPNFSLQHLRFLVIDEADRLITQSFQDWLAQVLSATHPPKQSSDISNASSLGEMTPRTCHDAIISRNDTLSPAWLPFPPSRSRVDEKPEASCQKLLFSATLTRDPAKISALELRNPKYFVVRDSPRDNAQDGQNFTGESFTFPATLKEHMIVCTSNQKPLILFHLFLNYGVKDALVFTKSVESTSRLVRLFQLFEEARNGGLATSKVCAYSSDLSTADRKSILDKFKAKEITVLVCSDLISRGIDISHVSHVVSYDAPVDIRKYVHRVGRTARAGRTGDAWSLIEEQEARYFKSMLAAADHLASVRKMKVKDNDLKALKDHYEAALKSYQSED